MCGIVGIISNEKVSSQFLERMTDALSHRGPDGYGYYYNEHIGFGHRRLAIVDLSESGKQPMEYQNRYVITYNGEIYNHIELREELKSKGYDFKNSTDTEVIMAAYDYWGENCQNYFNGMWAFVIYDKLNDEFFISRDRFGIKPLYYYHTKNVFIFASEIKSILLHPEVIAEENKEYTEAYLKYGPKEYIRETAYLNIFRFPYASGLISKKSELFIKVEPKVFWKINPNLRVEKFCPNKAHDYAQKYYDLLKDAVRLRLRADVKVGSALSGGLDSSSIVYLINEVFKEQGKKDMQETFSSVYKESGTEHCDESHYIDQLSKFLNVKSNQVEPKVDDIPKEHERMIYSMENPPESTCMSGWHTFKKVSETDVKVTLDGQGADEQLAGYLHYTLLYLTSLSLTDFYRELLNFYSIPGIKKTLIKAFILFHAKTLLSEKIFCKLFYFIMKREIDLNLNRRLAKDINTSLINLIHYSDRVSMAYGIESRMPFMDYRVVEFLASIPSSYKIREGWTKYIARLAFDKKLPDEICWRKDKMGWPIPEKYWFTGKLSDWLKNKLKVSDIEFDSKTVRKLNLSVMRNLFFEK